MAPRRQELPRITQPAAEDDVMREQLDYLLDWAGEHQHCECPECTRLLAIRAILMQPFVARRRS